MIKVYVMESCPDCTYVEEQIKGDDSYEIIDIGAHVKNLKEFLRLRDNDPVFESCKLEGFAGIPCFLFEDGTVTLNPEDLGLESRPAGSFCSLDRKGC